MNKTFTPMHAVLPARVGFGFSVEHFEVNAEQSRMTTINMHSGFDFVPPGKYVRLVKKGAEAWQHATVMSDTPAEQRTNYGVVNAARGDVFIAGLGLGMILVPICSKPEVKSVTVLEKHVAVRELVEVPLRKHLGRDASKLTVLEGDVFEWELPAGAKWDTIYFDIWTSQSTDTLKEIATLKRRFARRRREGGWMAAWNETRLRYQKRRERHMGW